ncbi:GNAT family N-acetyltransferase [Microlunatus soli]|uniref:Acetyltransferase (GNAT) family protein n=1 Tax=Microlunatus soli TaxID=630515 RepID=A0A1H2A369_9ACTN|nr:GNAT family N-acetyltransferase [Microlunatus soli]SDT39936.1 Acetyltransferase (GNAT) family protein [Microlunatus soli]
MTRTGVVLEMTDSSQLIESHRQADLTITEVPARNGGLIGDLYRQIWDPIGGGGRNSWTDQEWIDELDQPGVGAWVARLDGQNVGMAETGQPGDGDAGFVVIGVLPQLQGRGIGGDLLSRLTRRLWETTAPNGRATTRVWIWTIPDEHTHTIPNYLARGFRYAKDDADGTAARVGDI